MAGYDSHRIRFPGLWIGAWTPQRSEGLRLDAEARLNCMRARLHGEEQPSPRKVEADLLRAQAEHLTDYLMALDWRDSEAQRNFYSGVDWVSPVTLRHEGHAFKRESVEWLRAVLGMARAGFLPVDWRQQIVTEADVQYSNSPWSERFAVIAADLAQIPPQMWEPGRCQGDWRAALEAWHTAVNENYPLPLYAPPSAEIDREPVGLPAGGLAVFEAESLLRAETTNEWGATAALREADRWLAWEEAGRVAGGDPVDWRGNYRARVRSWDTSRDHYLGPLPTPEDELAALDVERPTIEIKGFDQKYITVGMEELPTYWM